MAKRITQKHRVLAQSEGVLALASSSGTLNAVHALNRGAEAIAMRLAKPGEPNHGPGYRARVAAVRELILDRA